MSPVFFPVLSSEFVRIPVFSCGALADNIASKFLPWHFAVLSKIQGNDTFCSVRRGIFLSSSSRFPSVFLLWVFLVGFDQFSCCVLRGSLVLLQDLLRKCVRLNGFPVLSIPFAASAVALRGLLQLNHVLCHGNHSC